MGIHFERGQALFELRRYQDAIAEYQQELAAAPGCIYSKGNIASCLINLSRFSEARRMLEETLAQAPAYGFAFYLLSFVEPKGSGASPALRAIMEAVRLEPRSARNITRMGWLQREQGRHATSLETATRALELDARFVDALVLRAKALQSLGRSEEATATLRAALAINPADPEAHLALGNVALACGDAGEALDALREARRISPVKHNQRDKILEALARRVWPFRQIDRWVKRWKQEGPLVRWSVFAAINTSLVALHAAVMPTLRNPWLPLCFLYAFLANGLLFLYRAPEYSKLVVRIVKRRELDLRLAPVLGENLRSILWLLFSHWLTTIAVLFVSMSPGFAYFVSAILMIAPPVNTAAERIHKRLALRQGKRALVIATAVICLVPAWMGGLAFSEFERSTAWGVWFAILVGTGLAAASRQRLARRRAG
jgi:tetratricopeptide (TPR) repeat protein